LFDAVVEDREVADRRAVGADEVDVAGQQHVPGNGGMTQAACAAPMTFGAGSGAVKMDPPVVMCRSSGTVAEMMRVEPVWKGRRHRRRRRGEGGPKSSRTWISVCGTLLWSVTHCSAPCLKTPALLTPPGEITVSRRW
jgi:hypothetical protein